MPKIKIQNGSVEDSSEEVERSCECLFFSAMKGRFLFRVI